MGEQAGVEVTGIACHGVGLQVGDRFVVRGALEHISRLFWERTQFAVEFETHDGGMRRIETAESVVLKIQAGSVIPIY